MNPERLNTKVGNVGSVDYWKFMIHRSLISTPSDNPVNFLIEWIRKKAGNLFTDKEKEFEQLLERLSKSVYSTSEDLSSIFATELSAFINTNYSLDEIERRMRSPEYRTRNNKATPLSEMLDYEVGEKNPNKIILHLRPSSTIPIGEKIKDVNMGLASLAQLLSVNSELSNITVISVSSWVVKKNPSLFQKLGFTLEEENDNDKLGGERRGRISKEDFLKKYLK